MRLEGKTAIITGSAGGIGRVAVEHFIKEGAKVALLDINEEGMKETVAGVEKPENCLVVKVDLLSAQSVKDAIAKVIDTFGKLDILYNNAAHNKNFKAALETTEADWDIEIGVTLKGAFLCAKNVLQHMIDNGGGVILNTGSWLAQASYVEYCAYCVAKGGLVQLTRSLAVDYSPKGVRVNMISPGAVDTPALAPIMADPEFAAAVNGLTLFGRIAKPEEVARVAVFLASDEASYVTGAIIPIDGGATARLG